MLRIHFTVTDIARTRIGPAPLPLLELDIAARVLQESCFPLRIQAWQRAATNRLRSRPRARELLRLIPPAGYSPEFLLPARAASVEDLLEDVRSTPARTVDRDMRAFAAQGKPPRWTARLLDTKDALPRLANDLADLYAALLGPDWDRLRATMDADRALRSRQQLDHGVEKVLSHINPRHVQWAAPVLKVRLTSGRDLDLHLDGRGILLVPSVFGVRRPYVIPDASPQPILVYPAHRATDVLFTRPVARDGHRLAALLGGTRAAVLTVIAEHPGRTTSDLARVLDISPASASEHATVLRNSGLISTERWRNTVLHSPTATGLSLLDASSDG